MKNNTLYYRHQRPSISETLLRFVLGCKNHIIMTVRNICSYGVLSVWSWGYEISSLFYDVWQKYLYENKVVFILGQILGFQNWIYAPIRDGV